MREPRAPKLLCVVMIFEHFLLLQRVIQFDFGLPFPHPIEKELSGAFADAARDRADFHIKRAGRGETERGGNVRNGSDQKPAALFKANVS